MDMTKETKIPDVGFTQHYDVVKELGECYASVGDFEQAHRCFEKAATLGPDEAAPYVGLGVVAMQQGKLEDAQVAFRVACRLDRNNSKAYCGLGMISQQKHDPQTAFEMYLTSLENDSNNLTALLGLFQTSCEMGSFSKVIHYLEVYLDMHPGDTSVMFCLASLLFKDSNFTRARELLLNILALDETNTDASNLLEEVDHSLAQDLVRSV
ncbi:MAG: tetratricopeptide repeat protein [Planctomycetes bacterium]|nr:tetratricopeptide repeat protein [Planctomycetota bacterium]